MSAATTTCESRPVDGAADAQNRLEAARARYCRNLSALYRRDPALAQRVDEWPFSRTPALEAGRDGSWTARLIDDEGREMYAHSRYQAAEEARRFVAAAIAGAGNTTGRDGPAAGEPTDIPTIVISGLGLGHHVLAADALCHRPMIIVIERDLGVIKAALCATELADLLEHGRLLLLTSADKSTLHEKLRPLATQLLIGLRCIALPHAARVDAAFHSEARCGLLDFVSYSRVQIMSILRNARVTCQNIVYNLPSYLASGGLEHLRDRAKGRPAILVAAGPSLARNVDQLAGLQDRTVIIAVQTVFKPLLERGVAPHFVTSLDYHEISLQFFSGVQDVQRCTLVAEPKATWHVLDAYPGKKLVLHSALLDDLLDDAAPRRAGLRAGSTVAHLSFYLAEYLGCDPIILLGQDLAYCEGFYYPPGTPVERVWSPELNRYGTIEMKQWERIVRARRMLHVVKDIHGRDAYSDDQLVTYAEQFQSDFLASRSRVIHACEGGMRLDGVEIMSLRDAAQRFCSGVIPGNLFADAADESIDAEPVRRVSEKLRERVGELRELRELAGQMHGLLVELETRLDQPCEFNRLVGRVDVLRMRIQRFEKLYGVVTAVSQMAELRRVCADRTFEDAADGGDDPLTARRRLKRDRSFVTDFMDGCDYWLGLLPNALARLEAALPTPATGAGA